MDFIGFPEPCFYSSFHTNLLFDLAFDLHKIKWTIHCLKKKDPHVHQTPNVAELKQA